MLVISQQLFLILSPKTNYNLGNHLGKWQHWYWLTTILRNHKYTTHSEETVRREWVLAGRRTRSLFQCSCSC